MVWDNHFLDSLTSRDIRALKPHLSRVELERNRVLDEVGQPIAAVYLPIDSILSVVTVMQSGAQVESRTIGRESGYGLLNALGSPISYERMLVQCGGRAWRAPLPTLRELGLRSPTLTQAIVRHAQATIIQSAQSTACNTLHSAEQRLCRWLLLTQDRLRSDVVPLTQEHLSIMLGVQRTTVTAVASQLQERGSISYVRGKITIRDRPDLLRGACECYAAIQRGAAAMLGVPEAELAPNLT
ncbi:Crp/Fnr family transcriptional regulator [Phenylobacterium hankyongense]|uniref:Crp/Fnr family transcriptional regulator n=1 Tax=Phenylobacterium hankyongense TaxID=1813876 RepID=A0A328AX29_9CAUL|nr:Crp/Fnr family transcriptional regulator [Phenylobacterium hankyongense]RAK58711.1 Crp/Fnr family transcriptional regulator [Phenylobacterium hankyongense]